MLLEKPIPAKLKCDFCDTEFFWDASINFCYMIFLNEGYTGYEEDIHICDKDCKGIKTVESFILNLRKRWHKEDMSDMRARKLYWNILKDIKKVNNIFFKKSNNNLINL